MRSASDQKIKTYSFDRVRGFHNSKAAVFKTNKFG